MTNQATKTKPEEATREALVNLAAEGIAAFLAQYEDYKQRQAEQQARGYDILGEKLSDAMSPAFQAEFDPDEAERAGAFVETAISEAAALDSVSD